ncbi:hypothetical protein EAS62_26315 [Bradyrhizobium zhanjiangense]|uniref:Uncharacterized protein n=1 Tax=Bradyrhizobium zhanjiangense TaxID=1325107 RepID=A0ABY0DFE5_9BRAD|nr:hypothetical protein EAS62_26315 [Bradyrhizobium zhanjiangense]
MQDAAADLLDHCHPGILDRPVERGDDTTNGEAACEQRAIRPQPLPAPRQCEQGARPRRGQISNVGKGMPAIPRLQENEGVGEHVRTRFHVGPKAACEIAEPLEENRTERRKLVSSAGPRKRNDPTVDLMSRRHPLSSTRTFRRR